MIFVGIPYSRIIIGFPSESGNNKLILLTKKESDEEHDVQFLMYGLVSHIMKVFQIILSVGNSFTKCLNAITLLPETSTMQDTALQFTLHLVGCYVRSFAKKKTGRGTCGSVFADSLSSGFLTFHIRASIEIGHKVTCFYSKRTTTSVVPTRRHTVTIFSR